MSALTTRRRSFAPPSTMMSIGTAPRPSTKSSASTTSSPISGCPCWAPFPISRSGLMSSWAASKAANQNGRAIPAASGSPLAATSPAPSSMTGWASRRRARKPISGSANSMSCAREKLPRASCSTTFCQLCARPATKSCRLHPAWTAGRFPGRSPKTASCSPSKTRSNLAKPCNWSKPWARASCAMSVTAMAAI